MSASPDFELLTNTINEQARVIAELKADNASLRWDLHEVAKAKDNVNAYLHYLNLENKIRRQANFIRQIQKVGWQPSFIIHEQPDRDDLHLWFEPEASPPKKHRTQNRYPARTA